MGNASISCWLFWARWLFLFQEIPFCLKRWPEDHEECICSLVCCFSALGLVNQFLPWSLFPGGCNKYVNSGYTSDNFSKLLTFYHTNKLNLFHFRSNCHFCPLHDLYFILQKSCSYSIKIFWQLKKKNKKEDDNALHQFTAQRPKILLLPVCWLPRALFASRICSRLWFFCLVRLFIIFPAFLISLPTTYALYLLRHPSFSLPSALLPEDNSYQCCLCFDSIRCSYLCNLLVSRSDINWWFQLLIL